MTAIWQWDNNNSNQHLIKKKDKINCFWTVAVYFAIECEITPQK